MQSLTNLNKLNTEISDLIAPHGFGPINLPPVCTADDLAIVVKVINFLTDRVAHTCEENFELCKKHIAHLNACLGDSAEARAKDLKQMELCASKAQKCLDKVLQASEDLGSYTLSC